VKKLRLNGISSKATKSVLARLTELYQTKTGIEVCIESIGGVEAAKRVQAGESFDVVLLAADAIDRLIASEIILPNSRRDWVLSPIAVAMKRGHPPIDLSSETSLKAAVLATPSLSYSTGPSGNYLRALFDRWGILDVIQSKVIVPPPGTPVGKLIADGLVTLGFQQLSELIEIPEVHVLGVLPPEIAFMTTFSAGIPSSLKGRDERIKEVHQFIEFIASNTHDEIKHQHGMMGICVVQ